VPQTQPASSPFRPRILVTADMTPEALAALNELGDVEYASFRTCLRLLSGDDLVHALDGVQVFVTEIDLVDAAVLPRLPDLRVVVACRGDAVNVDAAACAAYGVPVLNAPGRNADAVADLTVAFLLMLARKLPLATAFLRQPDIEAGDMGRMGQAYTTLQGRELWRKTIGLIGFGAVGRGVAARLGGFGCAVIVYDPYLPSGARLPDGVEAVDLPTLLSRSDFVSLHAPVSEETRGMIDAAALARMRRGACLVNTARAALLDEAALVDALRRGHLGGAALDVFATEPPGSDHPLLAMPTVITTPHVGGNTVEVGTHQGEIVAADLRRLLAGERPRHVVDPDALEGFDWHGPRRTPDPARLAALGGGRGPAVSDLQRDRPAPRPQAAPLPESVPSPAAAAAPAEVVERMERLLRDFFVRLRDDQNLLAFAGSHHVTLRFTLPDLDRAFFIGLRDGAVTADLGEPDPPADVELRMTAEVLDGMLRGTLNAMQAATSGRIAFRGDAMKAMALQQLQADLSRSWLAARAAVGDPGDLTTLAAPSAARSAPPPAHGPDLRGELVAVVTELYATQLITATGGNVSVRIPGTDQCWITPSQAFKGELHPDSLVRIDLDGNPLDEGAPSPSSERLMHCAIYRARPEAAAVIHAHAPHATILVNAGLPFLPVSTEAAFFGDIPRVPFIMPGTDELAHAVGEASRESWAVLMQNHGLIVAGRSLRRAADMVEIVDRSAQVILGCYAVGKTPPTLPDDAVATLRSLGDLMA
jgi:L-ribulose-5-phosphate 4-epimerase